MNNPFYHSLMRRAKHTNRVLYAVLSIFVLPKWLLWKLSELLNLYPLVIKIEEMFHAMLAPIRAVWNFIQAWMLSRPWKLLWLVLPLIVVVLTGSSMYFINANKNRGDAHSDYLDQGLKAFSEGDYKYADFLFSKIINHPSYRDNDQVLFQALLVANANGNVPRARALQDKLIYQREYEPAMRWLVSNTLRRGNVTASELKMMEPMARELVAQHADPYYVSFWRVSLTRLLMVKKDIHGAVAVLEAAEELTPEERLLLAQALVSLGQNDKAKLELRDMMAYLDREDADDVQFIKERVEGVAALSALTKDIEESRYLLERALYSVKRMRKLTADRTVADAWLREIRVRLFEVLLQQNDRDSRLLAFDHFEDALANNNPSYRAGKALNGLVDGNSGYSLLSGQIREVVVRNGGSGAHLAMAMDAWASGDRERTMLHLKVANAINPESINVMRYAATHSAQSSDPNKLDLNLFRGDNRSSYQRALDMLDLIVEMEPELVVDVVFDKCYIYSLRGNWLELAEVMEDVLPELDGQRRVQALSWLVRASGQLGRDDDAERYRREMLLARKMNIQNDRE